jgi:hypothetical protein
MWIQNATRRGKKKSESQEILEVYTELQGLDHDIQTELGTSLLQFNAVTSRGMQ